MKKLLSLLLLLLLLSMSGCAMAPNQGKVLTPTIEYNGKTFEIFQTLSYKDLHSAFPYANLEDEERIHYQDENLYIETEPWERITSSPHIGKYLFLLDKVGFSGCSLWQLRLAEAGASSNGVYIGDSYLDVKETFPMAETTLPESGNPEEDAFLYYIYFHNGRAYDYDEYAEEYLIYHSIDKGFREMQFLQFYDTQILAFYINDGQVEEIMLSLNQAWLYEHSNMLLTVDGTVCEMLSEENGTPIHHAIVSIYSHAEEAVVETIDMSETAGSFKAYLPVGEYTLTAEADGYVSTTIPFELSFDNLSLPVVLEPEAVEVIPEVPQVQSNEIELYTQYLLNGGYEEVLRRHEMSLNFVDPDYLKVYSVLMDIDGDGTREALVSLTDTKFSGPRGYASVSALLDIQSSTVTPVLSAFYSGGSMGGDDLLIKYDTDAQMYVVVLDGYFRDGAEASVSSFDVYNHHWELDHRAEYSYFRLVEGKSPWYEEMVTEIREETNLYEQTEDAFFAYTINNEYVTNEDYENFLSRFVEPNESAYQIYDGSYDVPFPG